MEEQYLRQFLSACQAALRDEGAHATLDSMAYLVVHELSTIYLNWMIGRRKSAQSHAYLRRHPRNS